MALTWESQFGAELIASVRRVPSFVPSSSWVISQSPRCCLVMRSDERVISTGVVSGIQGGVMDVELSPVVRRWVNPAMSARVARVFAVVTGVGEVGSVSRSSPWDCFLVVVPHSSRNANGLLEGRMDVEWMGHATEKN